MPQLEILTNLRLSQIPANFKQKTTELVACIQQKPASMVMVRISVSVCMHPSIDPSSLGDGGSQPVGHFRRHHRSVCPSQSHLDRLYVAGREPRIVQEDNGPHQVRAEHLSATRLHQLYRYRSQQPGLE